MPFSIFLKKAAEITDPDFLLADGAARAAYLRVPYARPHSGNWPVAIALPAHAGQLSSLLRLCAGHGVAARLRGQGTRTRPGYYDVGKPWLLISTSRMARILDIDARNRQVLAQAGADLANLGQSLAKTGLRLPPSLQSGSLGGAIAAGLSGSEGCLRSIKLALADGESLALPPPVAQDSVPLERPTLLSGSAGRLGVIVEAALSLEPVPESAVSFLATFPNALAAAKTATVIAESPRRPFRLYFIDGLAAMALGLDGGGVLLGLCEGAESETSAGIEEARAAASQAGGTFSDLPAGEAEALWQRTAWTAAAFGALREKTQCLGLACPAGSLPAVVEGAGQIAERAGGKVSIFGQAFSGELCAAIICGREASLEAMERELLVLGLVISRSLESERDMAMTPSAWLDAHPAYARLDTGIVRLFDPDGLFSG